MITNDLSHTQAHQKIMEALTTLLNASSSLRSAQTEPSLEPAEAELTLIREAHEAQKQTSNVIRTLAAHFDKFALPKEIRTRIHGFEDGELLEELRASANDVEGQLRR